MHALTHSIAHRAPSATRSRVRWQPYNPLSSQASSSSTSSRSPSSTQISTPTSISSPPSNTPPPEIKHSHTPQNQKDVPPPRDNSKKQFAVGLVDQAVKTLGEIWRPQDIPSAFSTTPRSAIPSSPQEHLTNSLISLSPLPSSGFCAPRSSCGTDARAIVPIKGFVHEVIRRSRTSGYVLQTALCYLEAIRPKIPDLLRQERSGQSMCNDVDISGRILPATEHELKLEEEYLQLEMSGIDSTDPLPPDLVSTIRVTDIPSVEHPPVPNQVLPPAMLEEDTCPLNGTTTSISALPSPLLCPRRAFLASLILASKFTQDKCYSNRAWAKLSGLPAREISRSERALGEALDWRLWVGKAPVQSSLGSSTPTASAISNRPVVRSQSESNILSMPATRSPFLARQDSRPSCVNPNSGRTLQRSSTLPAEVFASLPLNRVGASNCRSTQEMLEPVARPIMPSQAVVSYADGLSQSPSPDIPPLSYSPSSTESSSGDRTIQMSTFIDEPMAMYSGPQAPIAADFWPGSDVDSQEFRISPSAYAKSNRIGKAPAAADHYSLYALPAAIASVDLVTSAYTHIGSNPPWLLDGESFRTLPVVSQ